MTTSSERPVVDFDHHSEAYTAHALQWSREMQQKHPVAWSPHYGGFWVLSGYEEVFTAARDPERFSSFHDVSPELPGPRGYQGNAIPPMATQLLPPEIDPPQHTDQRARLISLFTPQMVDPWLKGFQDVTDFCLDRCIESGEIDFVDDFAILQLTLSTCLFMGLPTEGKLDWANTIKQQPQMRPDDPDYDRIVVKGWQDIHDELTAVAADRRKNPTGDIISKIVHAFEPGREYEIVSILKTVFAGGVETTAAVLSNTLVYLDENRAARQKLIDDPGILPKAREEFMRHFTPVGGLARTATKDTVLNGQKIAEGDRLFMWFHAANHDPAKFTNPGEVILDRNPNAHVSFGLGPHRCIGSNVARKNFDILLNTVLRRMPDYALIQDRVQRYKSTGQSNSYSRLPARFTPGPRIGPEFKL